MKYCVSCNYTDILMIDILNSLGEYDIDILYRHQAVRGSMFFTSQYRRELFKIYFHEPEFFML